LYEKSLLPVLFVPGFFPVLTDVFRATDPCFWIRETFDTPSRPGFLLLVRCRFPFFVLGTCLHFIHFFSPNAILGQMFPSDCPPPPVLRPWRLLRLKIGAPCHAIAPVGPHPLPAARLVCIFPRERGFPWRDEQHPLPLLVKSSAPRAHCGPVRRTRSFPAAKWSRRLLSRYRHGFRRLY